MYILHLFFFLFSKALFWFLRLRCSQALSRHSSVEVPVPHLWFWPLRLEGHLFPTPGTSRLSHGVMRSWGLSVLGLESACLGKGHWTWKGPQGPLTPVSICHVVHHHQAPGANCFRCWPSLPQPQVSLPPGLSRAGASERQRGILTRSWWKSQGAGPRIGGLTSTQHTGVDACAHLTLGCGQEPAGTTHLGRLRRRSPGHRASLGLQRKSPSPTLGGLREDLLQLCRPHL